MYAHRKMLDRFATPYAKPSFLPEVLIQHNNKPTDYLMPILRICLFLLIAHASMSQKENLLETLMRQKPAQFEAILQNPDLYEVQILYTQIDRDAQNRPQFTEHRYRVNKNNYFYPASTVKFPAVLLALEKINDLKVKGLSRNTTLLTDSASAAQTSVYGDTSAQNGLPSVAHYAKKILLVSDNDAFNRLYEFIGQQAFNDQLRTKGYADTRILHRLDHAATTEQNRYTNPLRFVDGERVLYQQPQQYNPVSLVPNVQILKGKGYLKNGVLIEKPFDFTAKNAFPLEDQQEILKAALFPESVAAKKRFKLTPDDYRFVYQYMSQLPSETNYPRYDSKEYYDSYCKFTLFGDSKNPMPKHIRVFNKVGDAYGFLLDNAYVVDFKAGVEFMLSAVIYCNKDQVFNDDKYDYEAVGFPFFANLGKIVYEHELGRKRLHKPNLDKFKLVYEK